MTAITPLEFVHKKGIFGDHHKKNESDLLKIYELKNLSIIQIFHHKKSKININEIKIDCALREFNEETRVLPEHHCIIEDIQPIEEEFIGTNMLKYKHVYYISRYNSDNIVFLSQFTSFFIIPHPTKKDA